MTPRPLPSMQEVRTLAKSEKWSQPVWTADEIKAACEYIRDEMNKDLAKSGRIEENTYNHGYSNAMHWAYQIVKEAFAPVFKEEK